MNDTPESGQDSGTASDNEAAYLNELSTKPLGTRMRGYVALSGPGWLQSALTLGGGSLTNSLYLGVLAGFSMLWLQPLAMILGIIMLSAIGYVTLSTGERPFRAINTHVNPVLGWGWLIASMLANMVWALPQYSLATAGLQQNLLPDLLGPGGPLGDFQSKLLIVTCILFLSIVVTWSYGGGSWGARLYEWMLKGVVGLIVLCFAGVVVRMAMSEQGIAWGSLLAGFIPDFGAIFRPADGFQPLLDAIAPEYRTYWSDLIVDKQRDVLMGAFATAVGINMTFLLPYSMLARGWGREHRGLAIFDLSTGMFIPFLIATSCVVIAAANQFYTVPQPGLIGSATASESTEKPTGKQQGEFDKMINGRIAQSSGESASEGISDAERQLAATLVTRDANALAKSLVPLFGGKRFVADILFGVGVLGMALSSITLLMLISGFVVCEVLEVPPTGWTYRLGSLAAATGVLGPFVWSGKAAFWLAVPTSVFGLVLLPIAYLSFFLLFNQKSLLGDQMPRGGKRIAANLALAVAAGVSMFASCWAVWAKAGVYGIAGVALFFGVALVVQFTRRSPQSGSTDT